VPPVVPLIAVAPAGLDLAVAAEIRALGGGVGHTKVLRGGRVAFDGPPDAVLRANLQLSMAERVLLPVGSGRARGFDQLLALAAEVPWERYVAPGMQVKSVVRSRGCRLHHTGAVADVITRAVQSRGLLLPRGDGAGKVTIDARGTGDEWTLCVDSTGPGLARRGYRKATAKAPLPEHLAAAILHLAGWEADVPLLDPACGAGTLAIEAARRAQGRAPGLDRGFAFERWPDHDATRWAALREAARERLDPDAGGLSLQACDRRRGAVEAARSNSERAGTAAVLKISRRTIERTPPEPGPGLVVFNPPYGQRTDPVDLAGWRRALDEARPDWDVVFVAPKAVAEGFGVQPRPLGKLSVGGVRVAVWRRQG